MLTRNVWQSRGLYNGSLGTVCGLLYREHVRQPAQPYCVLVEFDDYRGPSAADEPCIVPIVPDVVAFDLQSGKHEAETDVDAETELDPELKGDTVLEMLTGLKYAVVHAFIPSANERKNILAIINEITAKTKAIQESAQAKTNEDIAEIKSMLKAKPTYAQALQAKSE